MPKGRRKEQVMVPGQWMLKAHDKREIYVPHARNEGRRKREVWRQPMWQDHWYRNYWLHSISINNVWLVDGLKHNILSISQFCDNGYDVLFDKIRCTVVNKNDNSIVFKGKRIDNAYKINFSELVDKKLVWHKRLGHANWRLISKLSKLQLVKGLPDIEYHSDALCGACQIGKIVKTSFKA